MSFDLYTRCGKSGIILPRLSLGWWKNFGSNRPYETARQMALAAFDAGICHFDLANNYGPLPGTAEETLGKLMLTDLRGHRDELFISSKAGYDMWPGPYGTWCSRKNLLASLDQSLKRMNLDYVDLFYIHRYDPNTPLEESLQAVVDAVRQGKVLYAGISRWPLEALKFGVEYLRQRDVPLLCFQDKLNLINREPQDEGIMNYLIEQNIGFVGFSPLAQGLLTDRYLAADGISIPKDSRISMEDTLEQSALTPKLVNALRQMQQIAQQRGQSVAELSLQWLLTQPGVTSAIIGTSSVAQLKQNLAVLNAPDLSLEEANKIGKLFE